MRNVRRGVGLKWLGAEELLVVVILLVICEIVMGGPGLVDLLINPGLYTPLHFEG